MEIQFIGQGCSKKPFYKWLRSEVVLNYGKMKQPSYSADALGTVSLGDAGLLGVHAVPDGKLSTGTTHPCRGAGVSARPP